MSLQILKKEIKDEVHFLHADKHQRFLQVHFNILGIKVSCKVILSLIGMDKHSQIMQSNKFALSLKYVRKWNLVHFLHADKYKVSAGWYYCC